MLGEYWLLVSGTILIIGLLLQQLPLALAALLLLATGALSRLWSRFCLHRVTVQRRLSRRRVFFGDTLTYEVEISNRKPLPLPWLVVEDEIPDKVTLLKGRAQRVQNDRCLLGHMLPMNMYHRVTRRFPIQCRQRGIFTFGPAMIHSGDLFGLFRRRRRVTELDYLTVYPRLVPLERLGISSRVFFGDIRLKRHLHHDPVLTVGVREYQSGDSLKRIHWKSTARLGRLQTRIFEPATSVDLIIFLDVRTLTAMLWGHVVQLLEIAIMVAAAIGRHALESGFGAGLYVNQTARFAQGLIKVPSSRHPDQLLRILEALAQIHHMEAMPMARLIRREAAGLPWGSTLVVISARPFAELLAVLSDLKRAGRSVVLIKVGGRPLPDGAGGLRVYHVRAETAWDLVTHINLEAQESEIEQHLGA